MFYLDWHFLLNVQQQVSSSWHDQHFILLLFLDLHAEFFHLHRFNDITANVLNVFDFWYQPKAYRINHQPRHKLFDISTVPSTVQQ